MSTSASDLMMATLPILHTPNLARAVQHYRQVMGFDVVQHITGVLAILRQGELHLYLWQKGQNAAMAGPAGFQPGHHRASVSCVFEAHSLAWRALHKNASTSLLGTLRPELRRLSGAPVFQPWGAWEFSLTDGDDNVLHFVQWVGSKAAKVANASQSPQGTVQPHKEALTKPTRVTPPIQPKSPIKRNS